MEQFVPTQLVAIQLMCMSTCKQLAQHVLPVLKRPIVCWRLVIFERYLGCQHATFSARYGLSHHVRPPFRTLSSYTDATLRLPSSYFLKVRV